jgi:uncharacterized protein involved in type VI secretion and phage assembly
LRVDPGAEEEVVVLTDTNAAIRSVEAMRGVTYARHGLADEGAIVELTYTHTVVPREVLLADYDWRKPAVELLSPWPVDRHGRGLVFSGAQHYRDVAYGRQLARVRAEELLVERDVYRGRSPTAAACASGATEHATLPAAS